MEKLTFANIVEAAVGVDTKGDPRAVFSMMKSDDKGPDFIGGYAYCRIRAVQGYISIDVVFPTVKDRGLHNMWKKLEDVGESEKLNFGLEIYPVDMSGRYYLKAENPIYWVLQPERVMQEDLRAIRMLFLADDVQAVESGVEAKIEDTIEELAEKRMELEKHYENLDK